METRYKTLIVAIIWLLCLIIAFIAFSQKHFITFNHISQYEEHQRTMARHLNAVLEQ